MDIGRPRRSRQYLGLKGVEGARGILDGGSTEEGESDEREEGALLGNSKRESPSFWK